MSLPAVPLYDYQQAWFRDRSRFKLGMFARQTGKTFTTTLEIADDCFEAVVNQQRTRWVILSRGERQAKEAMEEGIKRHCQAYQLGFDVADHDFKTDGGNFRALEVVLPGGTRITSLPANPDTARGFSANCYLDEFAFHADSKKIWGALFPVVSNGYKLRVTSTPNGKGNKFYELASATDSRWSRHQVDIYKAVADGLPRDIDELREALNDGDLWAQEYELQWLDEASSWLSFDLINGVESDAAGERDGYAGGDCYVGIDIGRRNDLFVIWVLERVGDVLWTREIITRKRASFAEQDELLDDVMRYYRVRQVYMDQTGMGEKPVEDAQRRYGSSRVQGVIFTGTAKYHLAQIGKEAFEDRQIRIPQGDSALRSDLHKLKKVSSPTGAPRFIAESDSSGHADRAWACFLAVEASRTGGEEIDYRSTGTRSSAAVASAFAGNTAGQYTDSGFGTVAGANDFGGYL
jgi:phage FluMu gp28-like protein